MEFHPRLASLCTRHLRKPQPFPAIAATGPKSRAWGWGNLRVRIRELHADIRAGKAGGSFALNYADGLLRLFADKAELELEANTATTLKKERHQMPRP